jgi:hypothetical protein
LRPGFSSAFLGLGNPYRMLNRLATYGLFRRE